MSQVRILSSRLEGSPPLTKSKIAKAMSRSKFHSKFKSDLKKLTAAVEGTIALDEDYPKLYQKLIRFYEDQGIQLYDDPEDDYNVIMDSVESDLIESGVYA